MFSSAGNGHGINCKCVKCQPYMVESERDKFRDRCERLLLALELNQNALRVLNTMCDVAGLKQGQLTAYEMHENNNKLIAIIKDQDKSALQR
jgi:hypothetical protein